MISGVDIKDWDNQPATNGKGWEVQKLTEKGWRSYDEGFTDKSQADYFCEYYSNTWPHIEFRVYEVLE